MEVHVRCFADEGQNYRLVATKLISACCCSLRGSSIQMRKYLRTWLENHEDHQARFAMRVIKRWCCKPPEALVEGIEVPPDFEYDAWRRSFSLAAAVPPTGTRLGGI